MGFPGDSLSRHPTRGSRFNRPPSGASTPVRRWIPIRSLAPRHRPRLAAHLLELGPHDRYLRFGYPASDAHIGEYVDKLNFKRDELFGVFNRRLQLIAMAHLAYEGQPQGPLQKTGQPAMAEFGVSVSPHARGHGLGARLFEHAVTHARNRRIGTMYIHALSENTAMLKIARKAGARVVHDGAELDMYLQLPQQNLASQIEEAIDTQMAEADYRLKQHSKFLNEFLDALEEVKAAIARVRQTRIE